ncbi:hypothetical protein [Vibrio fluvialis]|uniref:hypothetical protein n=1 Tax=Vibrio fluvialis TaxID=676 RepID=UPI001F2BE4E0|nr:hypothetical protein [Vibrio fluvialis]MCE7622111.1 hypothetical protein [Vibrio fluvialis]
MIKVDVDALEGADLQKIMQTARDMVAKWGFEHQYFNNEKGNPYFEKNEYQNLLNVAQHNYQTLQGALQQSAQSSRSPDQLVGLIRAFQDSYSALIKYRHACSDVGRLEDEFFERLSNLEDNVALTTQKKIDELSAAVREDISKGIQDLIGLKSELGLAKQFGGKIQDELKDAKATEKTFFSALIVCLVLIPFINGVILFSFSGLDLLSKYLLMGSVTLSILFVSYFLYAQYRTYMMLRLRYTHLDGFLGGGATFLSQLLEAENPEFKLEVNKKLAEMFMSLDDVLQMVHKSKHPTELTLDTAEKVFDKVSKFKKASS